MSHSRCASFRMSGCFITACHSTAFTPHTSSSPRIRFLYMPNFCPEAKYQRKYHSPVLQVWPDDVTLGYFQGTHFSPSQQDCSTPSLSRWVSGHIPAFPTHTFHGLFMWGPSVYSPESLCKLTLTLDPLWCRQPISLPGLRVKAVGTSASWSRWYPLSHPL